MKIPYCMAVAGVDALVTKNNSKFTAVTDKLKLKLTFRQIRAGVAIALDYCNLDGGDHRSIIFKLDNDAGIKLVLALAEAILFESKENYELELKLELNKFKAIPDTLHPVIASAVNSSIGSIVRYANIYIGQKNGNVWISINNAEGTLPDVKFDMGNLEKL